MSIPKWNDERTAALEGIVGDESPVSVETVGSAAEQLETTTRSVAAKLRKMGYDVTSVATAHNKTFNDGQEDTLRDFVESNSGEYTYGEIAGALFEGEFSPKAIQGKILSMELTEHVKPTPKQEVAKKYTPEEEAKFIELANDGAYLEDIAEALGKTLNSVRGKALSLSRNESIEMPKQKQSHASTKEDPVTSLGDRIAEMTVAEIAEETGKTERGIKTLLTRRGLSCSDHDGAKRAEKIAASKEEKAA